MATANASGVQRKMKSPPWQFRLRSMLALLVVISCLLAVPGLHFHRMRRQVAAQKTITDSGGLAYYGYQVHDGRLRADTPSPMPAWLIDRVGQQNLRTVVYVSLRGRHITDKQLLPLADLAWLKWVDLRDSSITDAGLRWLVENTNLERLSVENTSLCDAALRELGRMKSLRYVWLGGTKVTKTTLRLLREQLPGCQLDTGGPLINSSE